MWSRQLGISSVIFTLLLSLLPGYIVATDADGDGYDLELGDPDDNNPAIHPDAIDRENGIDDDGDGLIDENPLFDWLRFAGKSNRSKAGMYGASVEIGSYVYYSGWSESTGSELMRFNKTTGAQELVFDLYPGRTGSAPFNLTLVDGSIFFYAFTSTNHTSLYRYAPGDSQPTRIIDVGQGGQHFTVFESMRQVSLGSYNWLTASDDDSVLYFVNGEENDHTVWQYVLATGATSQLADPLNALPVTLGTIRDIAYRNGYLAFLHGPWNFLARNLTQYNTLTDTATTSFMDGANDLSATSIGFYSQGGNSGINDREPFLAPFGGAPYLIQDARPGTRGSRPAFIGEHAGWIYLVAETSATGSSTVMRYNGTDIEVFSYPNANYLLYYNQMVEFSGQLYAFGHDRSGENAVLTRIETASLSLVDLPLPQNSFGRSSSMSFIEFHGTDGADMIVTISSETNAELWRFNPIMESGSEMVPWEYGGQGGGLGGAAVFKDVLYAGATYFDGIGRKLMRYDPAVGEIELMEKAHGQEVSFSALWPEENHLLGSFFNESGEFDPTSNTFHTLNFRADGMVLTPSGLWAIGWKNNVSGIFWCDTSTRSVEPALPTEITGTSGREQPELIGNRVYFSGYHADTGVELYYHDITTNMVALAVDLRPGNIGGLRRFVGTYDHDILITGRSVSGANEQFYWYKDAEDTLTHVSALAGYSIRDPGIAVGNLRYCTASISTDSYLIRWNMDTDEVLVEDIPQDVQTRDGIVNYQGTPLIAAKIDQRDWNMYAIDTNTLSLSLRTNLGADSESTISQQLGIVGVVGDEVLINRDVPGIGYSSWAWKPDENPTIAAASTWDIAGNVDQLATFTASEPEDETLTWSIAVAPQHATMSVHSQNNTSATLRCIPQAGYSGPDYAIVRVRTGDGEEASRYVRLAITSDTTAPISPNQLDLADASDSGVFANDDVTADLQPRFTGNSEPFALITIFVNDVEAGQVTADQSGAFAWQPATPLPAGTLLVRAVATDTSDNTSPSSVPLSVTLDTTAPQFTLALQPGYTNPSNADEIMFTATANEPVYTWNQSNFSLSNAALTTFTPDATLTSAEIGLTPSADGLITLAIADAALTDLAGNVTSAQQASILSDRRPPGWSHAGPDMLPTGVDSLSVSLSETVTISLPQLSLWRNSTEQPAIPGVDFVLRTDSQTMTISGLDTATASGGFYSLILNPSTVSDLAGNHPSDSLTISWGTIHRGGSGSSAVTLALLGDSPSSRSALGIADINLYRYVGDDTYAVTEDLLPESGYVVAEADSASALTALSMPAASANGGTILLAEGWNLLGVCQGDALTWDPDAIMVRRNGASLSLAEAASLENPWILPYAWIWEAGSYRLITSAHVEPVAYSDAIAAGAAFWCKALMTGVEVLHPSVVTQ